MRFRLPIYSKANGPIPSRLGQEMKRQEAKEISEIDASAAKCSIDMNIYA